MSIFTDEVENPIFWVEKFLKSRYSNSLGALQETSKIVSNRKKGREVCMVLGMMVFDNAI